jgi:parallel beta-helix repeat protein
VLLLPASVRAADYYVAVDGSDSAAGSMGAPFATVGHAQTVANAGDTVFIRGGRYAFSGSGTVGVSFTKSGKENQPINYFAYTGETPVFDLSDLTPSNRVTGLDVHCNWVHLRGLEVMGVHQYMSGQDSWGVRIQGSNNVLENLNVHNNDAPGVFITSGADNLILNCDSHDNYEPDLELRFARQLRRARRRRQRRRLRLPLVRRRERPARLPRVRQQRRRLRFHQRFGQLPRRAILLVQKRLAARHHHGGR